MNLKHLKNLKSLKKVNKEVSMPKKSKYETDPAYGAAWFFLKNEKVPVSAPDLIRCVIEGFSPDSFKRFVEEIRRSNKRLYLITEDICNQVVSSSTTYFFARVAATLYPNVIRRYLKRQSKKCFLQDYICTENLMRYILLTVPYNRFLKNARHLKLPIVIIADSVVEEFLRDDKMIFKAVRTKLTIEVLYKGKAISVHYKSQNCKQWSKTVSSFKTFRKIFSDVERSDFNFKEAKSKYSLVGTVAVLVFTTFSPDKILKEYKDTGWKCIKLNMPLTTCNMILNESHSLLKGQSSSVAYRYLGAMDKEFYEQFQTLFKKLIKIQKRTLLIANKNMLKSRSSNLQFTYLNPSTMLINSVGLKVNFSHLPLYTEFSEFIMSELKKYHRKKQVPSSQLHTFTNLLNYLVEKESNDSGFCIAKVNIETFENYLKIENTSHGAGRGASEYLNKFVKFLQNCKPLLKIGILPPAPTKNITLGIKIKVKETGKNFQPIPESIYLQIMQNINYLDASFKNAFILMAAGALRPQDLVNITVESKGENNGKKELIIWMKKQEKAYAKRGRKPKRTIPIIDASIEAAFDEQVLLSENNRKQSNIDSIFVIEKSKQRKHDFRFSVMSSWQLQSKINKLIEEYNILDNHGNLWHYHPYQLRVKLVVDMLEQGAIDKELKAFMGWLSETTYRNSYAMAQKLKMKDMNVSFLNWEFKTDLSEDALDLYNENERHLIFTELYEHKRDMGYGECVRHPIQGECGKLQEANSCAPCSKLITGEMYRRVWEGYYHNQFKYVFEIRQGNLKHGISPEKFERSSRYKYEIGILENYASVLMNLDIKRKVVN